MFRDKESRLPVLCLAWLLQATSTLSQVDQKKEVRFFSKKGCICTAAHACVVAGKFDESVGKCLRLRYSHGSLYPPPCLAAASSPLPTTNPSGVGVVVQLLPPFS